MHNNSKLKIGLSLVYALLLTLFFIVFFLCIGFSLGLFNDKSVTRAMKESNYYNDIHKALNNYCEELVKEADLHCW